MEKKSNCKESLKLDNQLCHRLYVVSNALTRAYRPYLNSLNLTYPQYVVMMALWEKDGVTISDLHQRTQIDCGALTLILKKLADKELLLLTQGEQDKRQKRLRLTLAGVALHQQALAYGDRLGCNTVLLETEEIQVLTALMDKLRYKLYTVIGENTGKCAEEKK